MDPESEIHWFAGPSCASATGTVDASIDRRTADFAKPDRDFCILEEEREDLLVSIDRLC